MNIYIQLGGVVVDEYKCESTQLLHVWSNEPDDPSRGGVLHLLQAGMGPEQVFQHTFGGNSPRVAKGYLSVQLDVEQAKLLRATLDAFIRDGDGGIAGAERRIAEKVMQAVRLETARAFFDDDGLCVRLPPNSDVQDLHDTFIHNAKSEALLLMLLRSRLGHVEPTRENT